jgi:hypothetical protein
MLEGEYFLHAMGMASQYENLPRDSLKTSGNFL